MAARIPSLPNYVQANNPASYYDLGALNREAADTAAARAVGMGIPGSPFARNMETAFRFSEQQRFLQPYLDREHQAGMAAAEMANRTALEAMRIGANQQQQQTQIAADAARQAIELAGMDRRLTAQQRGALELAILNGNQQMQDTILREAGASARQSAEISAGFQRALLPFVMRQQELRQERIPAPWTGPRTIPAGVSQVIGAPAPSRPATTPEFNMSPVVGKSPQMSVVDRTLAMYGLGPRSPDADAYANWSKATGIGFNGPVAGPRAIYNTGEYPTMGPMAPGSAAMQAYYDEAAPYGEFEWLPPTSAAMAEQQAYYE